MENISKIKFEHTTITQCNSVTGIDMYNPTYSVYLMLNMDIIIIIRFY